MSSIARKLLLVSLIYLILGLLAQVIAVFDAWLGFNPLAYTAVAATEQILLVGWLTQLGLAWVYERWLPDPGSSGWAVFILFNIGLPLVIVGQPGLALFGGQMLGAVAAFGSLLQLFAGLIFVFNLWKNV